MTRASTPRPSRTPGTRFRDLSAESLARTAAYRARERRIYNELATRRVDGWKCIPCMVDAHRSCNRTIPITLHTKGVRVSVTADCECGHDA